MKIKKCFDKMISKEDFQGYENLKNFYFLFA